MSWVAKGGEGNDLLSVSSSQPQPRTFIRYAIAVQDLSSEEAGSACEGDAEQLRKYLLVWKRHLKVMMKEKMREDRLKVRFSAFKGRQQALQRLANAILGRTSVVRRRLMRLARGGAAPVGFDPDNEKQLNEQLQRWKAEATRMRPHDGKHRVVAFGDGDFPAGYRKNRAVPRKALLRLLMHASTVLLVDEFHTSKCCPGCGGDLHTTHKRLRQCNTGPDKCAVRREFPDGVDRDVLGAINILLCAWCLLTTGERPERLRRGAGQKASGGKPKRPRRGVCQEAVAERAGAPPTSVPA